MPSLKSDYEALKYTHKNNVKKLINIQKKITRIKKDTFRLQNIANDLLGKNMVDGFKIRKYKKQMDRDSHLRDKDTLAFRKKIDYTVRCINWLNKVTIDKLKPSFVNMTSDSIIIMCHKRYHKHLLHGFEFVLSRECTQNGCMSWVYGSTHCACKKTQVTYDDKNIDYGYNGCIHLDGNTPVYRISF